MTDEGMYYLANRFIPHPIYANQTICRLPDFVYAGEPVRWGPEYVRSPQSGLLPLGRALRNQVRAVCRRPAQPRQALPPPGNRATHRQRRRAHPSLPVRPLQPHLPAQRQLGMGRQRRQRKPAASVQAVLPQKVRPVSPPAGRFRSARQSGAVPECRHRKQQFSSPLRQHAGGGTAHHDWPQIGIVHFHWREPGRVSGLRARPHRLLQRGAQRGILETLRQHRQRRRFSDGAGLRGFYARQVHSRAVWPRQKLHRQRLPLDDLVGLQQQLPVSQAANPGVALSVHQPVHADERRERSYRQPADSPEVPGFPPLERQSDQPPERGAFRIGYLRRRRRRLRPQLPESNYFLPFHRAAKRQLQQRPAGC